MQLLGVARLGPRLLHHLGDRLRVERADPGRVGRRERPPQHDRAGPALLERRVVEEGVGLRAQDLVGERRGLGEVAGHEPHLPGLDALGGAARGPPRPWPRRGSRGASRRRAGGRAARRGPRAGRRCPGRPPPWGRPRRAGRRPACGRWAAAPCARPARAGAPARGWRSSASGSGTWATASAAWASTSSRRAEESISKIDASGKQCCGPSESSTPSSVAAACSSKSKARQKRLRSASPSARFRRAPKGAWRTSCMPPASSKKRSATSVSWVGKHRECGAAGARGSRPPAGPRPPASPPRRRARRWRRRDPRAAARGRRAAARPPPRGPRSARAPRRARTGCPGPRRRRPPPGPRPTRCAGCARRCCRAGRRRPAMLSMAKSSSTCPTATPSGSATTWYSALSGMAPPPVSAAMRAPRRPRTTWCTPSRWRSAPERPRRVAMPSESMATIASNSRRGSAR